MINMDEIKLTQGLVRINSENPPGNEKEIAKFIRDYLDDLKIQTKLIKIMKNRFNVIASLGKREGMMLYGHMDTVPAGDLGTWKYEPFKAKIIDGRIYGRGTSDMKGGLAAILTAVKNLARENFKRKLFLAFVADEEATQLGTDYLIDNRKGLLKGIKYGVVGECTELKIRIAQKGIAIFKVKFRGKAAHGSKPELGDNAILKASEFIQELKNLSKKLKKVKTPLLGSGTINIGKISGGIKVNVVPDYCEVEIDRRLVPSETPKLAIKQIKNVLKKLELKGEIEIMKEGRLPMYIKETSKIVKILRNVIKTDMIGESGYTEAEMYYRDAGIPCVAFGPGISALAHISNEYIPIKNIKKAVNVYEKLIKKVCL